MPYYINPNVNGLLSTASKGDGNGITLRWATAYPQIKTNSISYNIYISTNQDYTIPIDLFNNYPLFTCVDGYTKVDILDLNPGQLYFFGVRAVEYNPSISNLNALTFIYNKLRIIPQSLLAHNVGINDLSVTLLDSSNFPSFGVLRVGAELMQYNSVNYTSNIFNILQRGYNGSLQSIHNTDGYDGYIIRNPFATIYTGIEEQNTKVYECENRFEYPNYSYTAADGYKQKTVDLVTSNLSGSDAFNENFPSYDYAGYHRTDPVALLTGDCVGSYIGGEMYCADGYSGVGRKLRGMSVQDQNNQRQEMLLSLTGEPVVLVSRRRTGVVCNCYTPETESPDDRCINCLGTGIVIGWNQYHNARRSDGRIVVRFSNANEDVKLNETGYESEMITDCWTLTVPTVKDRDFIVRFDQDDNEEYRYEILNVNRNKTLNRLSGGQKFQVQRVRKTDPIYKVKVFGNSSLFPATLITSVATSTGIPPHSHTISISEKTTNINQINQITSVAAGHSHVVKAGQVMVSLGHFHTIIL